MERQSDNSRAESAIHAQQVMPSLECAAIVNRLSFPEGTSTGGRSAHPEIAESDCLDHLRLIGYQPLEPLASGKRLFSAVTISVAVIALVIERWSQPDGGGGVGAEQVAFTDVAA